MFSRPYVIDFVERVLIHHALQHLGCEREFWRAHHPRIGLWHLLEDPWIVLLNVALRVQATL